jgi:hypothetical protein
LKAVSRIAEWQAVLPFVLEVTGSVNDYVTGSVSLTQL